MLHDGVLLCYAQQGEDGKAPQPTNPTERQAGKAREGAAADQLGRKASRESKGRRRSRPTRQKGKQRKQGKAPQPTNSTERQAMKAREGAAADQLGRKASMESKGRRCSRPTRR